MAVALVMTAEELQAAISRAVEPLRVELERLRADRHQDPVSIPEAARRLGVDVRTVQRWVKQGDLKAEQIGGRRFIWLPDGSTQG